MGFSSPVKKVIHQIEGYPQSLWITLCITYDWKDGMAWLPFPPLFWGKEMEKRPRLYPGRALRSESLTGLPPCGAACSTPPKRPY